MYLTGPDLAIGQRGRTGKDKDTAQSINMHRIHQAKNLKPKNKCLRKISNHNLYSHVL